MSAWMYRGYYDDYTNHNSKQDKTSPSQPQQTAQSSQSPTNNPLYNGPDPEPKLSANSSNPSPIQKNEEITENFIKITPDVFVKQVFEQVKTIISSSNSNKKQEIINIIDNCITYINKPEAKITFTESSSNLENSKLYYELIQGFCYNVAYIFRDILDKKPGSDKLLLFQNQYNALCKTYNKIVENSAEVIRQLEDEIKRSNCQNKKLSEIQGVIAKNFNEIIAERNAKLADLQAKCPTGDCDLDDNSDSDCEVCDEKPLQEAKPQAQTNVSQTSQNATQQVAVGIVALDKKKLEINELNDSITNSSNSSKEIETLKKTISDQTAEIAGKENEIKTLEEKIKALTQNSQNSQNSQVNIKRSELEAELKKKQEELDKLTEELSDLKTAKEESEAELKQAVDNANAARQEAQTAKTNAENALQNTKDKYNANIKEKEDLISELEKQLSKSSANAQENQKIKQQIEQLQQEIQNTKIALNTAKKATTNSQAAIREVQSARNAALAARNAALAARNAALAEKNAYLAEKSKAQTRISTAQAARNTALQNASTTKLELQALQEKFNAFTSEEAIKQRAAAVKAEEESKRKAVEEAEAKRRADEKEVADLQKKILSYTSLKENYDRINTQENLEKLKSNSDTRFDETKQNTILFNGGTLKDLTTSFSSETNLVALRTIISTMDTVNEEFINILEDLNGTIRVIVRIKPTSEKGSIISTLDTATKKYNFTVSCGNSQNTNYSNYYNIFPDPPFSNYGVYSGISQIRDNADKTKVNSADNTPFNLRKSFDQVKQGYSIVLFGYGYSGSGKTYTLLGSEAKEKTPAINGVLQYGIEDLIKSGSQIKLKYIFEEYIGNINDIFNVSLIYH